MPQRVPWDPEFATGNELIDAQHRTLLDQCRLLADLCLGTEDDEAARRFDAALDGLKTLVRGHFESEAPLRAEGGPDAIDDHQDELDEFEYLAGEIATTEKFDRPEVQRFLCFWCLGHVKGSAEALRTLGRRDACPL